MSSPSSAKLHGPAFRVDFYNLPEVTSGGKSKVGHGCAEKCRHPPSIMKPTLFFKKKISWKIFLEWVVGVGSDDSAAKPYYPDPRPREIEG